MVETLNSEIDALTQETEKVLSGFKKKESNFKNEIQEEIDAREEAINAIEDGKIQQIEKIGKNKIRFPYESNEHECVLILEKRGNNIFVKLEKGKIPTYMGNQMNNEFKKAEKKQWLIGQTIDASSSETFLKGLGKALDDIIGKGRVSAAGKAKEAYKLLGFTAN